MKKLIAKINKKLGLKKYCKRCTWYRTYIKAFDGYTYSTDRPICDGKNICGRSFNYQTDVIGQTRLKAYGDVDRCDHCGLVRHDARVIRFEFCSDKNHKLKCKYFNPKWILKLFFIGV